MADGDQRELHRLLHDRFGFDDFRPYQEAVCRAVIDGDDVLLVMPTGAGKSLCYQVPGIARGGATLIISPLIALMEDQTAKLRASGLRAERIHSGLARDEARAAARAWSDGTLDYLFVAPERLGVAGFPEFLARRTPALVAVDEAHCISHWGHDFRPDYRLLGERLPALRPAPIIAMTATATPRVQDDIAEQLGMGGCRRFIHGFRRTNIGVEVVELRPSLREPAVERLLNEPGRRPAIVYAPTRKQAESIARRLGRGAVAYHAGLPAETRHAAQQAFLSGDADVVVATIAFGMGIDKPDVRTVIHTALPASVEGYYQEIGRAGRDGQPSRAVLLYGFVDRRTQEWLLDRDWPDPEPLRRVRAALGDGPAGVDDVVSRTGQDRDTVQRALDKLRAQGGVVADGEDAFRAGHDEWERPYLSMRRHRLEQLALMLRFAESRRCRMLGLVRHFGDQEDDGRICEVCDVCAPQSCVASAWRRPGLSERAALERILDELRRRDGQATGRLHRELFGEALPRRRFEQLLGALIRAGLILEREEAFERDGRTIEYRRVALTADGRDATDAGEVLVPAEPEAAAPASRRARRRLSETPSAGGSQPTLVESAPADPALVEALRRWRVDEARRRRVPAYCILHDRTLEAVASARPANESQLLAVKGVGPKVTERYGARLLELLRDASESA